MASFYILRKTLSVAEKIVITFRRSRPKIKIILSIFRLFYGAYSCTESIFFFFAK